MVDHNHDRSDDEAQDDEATDSNDTMSNDDYTFIGDEESEDDSQQTTDSQWNWGLGDHSTASDDEKSELSAAIGETMDDLDGDLDADLMDVLKDTQDLVRSTSINRYECPLADCGLGHSHPDSKHDIRSHHNSGPIAGFNIDPTFAEDMKFCPFCHCGANEAAMLVRFFPYFDQPMFKDQQEFEGVLEVEPDVLEAMYRRYNDADASVSVAAGIVATRRGLTESEAIPLGVREDIKMFFARRQQIEQQAEKAPIAQETRAEIEGGRKFMEEQISQ